MNPVTPNPQMQVLAMTLGDVRATLAQSQAVQAAQGDPATQAARTADVILDLSTAAQALVGR